MKVYPDINDSEGHEGVRPPPQPPITIRTMNSDVTSMQESGGGAPKEEMLNVPRPPIRPEPPKIPDEGIKMKIPGYSGPERGTFPSESFPVKAKEVEVPKIEVSGGAPAGNKAVKAVVLIVIIVAAALIGAGLYFYVYPLLLSNTSSEKTTEVTPPPAPTPQPAPPAPTSRVHTSFITADKTEEVPTLSAVSAETVDPGKSLVKEVILKKSGNSIALSEYLPILIPELKASEVVNNFDEDFTAFIYYDGNGAWPGLVLKRKSNVVSTVAQTAFKKIESSKSLTGLFLNNPGTQTGEFKDGEYKGVSTRYLVFGSKGAAINYAWTGDRLILTTTFPALQTLIDGRLVK